MYLIEHKGTASIQVCIHYLKAEHQGSLTSIISKADFEPRETAVLLSRQYLELPSVITIHSTA